MSLQSAFDYSNTSVTAWIALRRRFDWSQRAYNPDRGWTWRDSIRGQAFGAWTLFHRARHYGKLVFEVIWSLKVCSTFVETHNRRAVFQKIERNADFTMSRATSSEALSRLSQNQHSLNALHARTGSIGREIARLKAGGLEARNQTFRVARVGPGWVLGSIEALSGTAHPGTMVAGKKIHFHVEYFRISTLYARFSNTWKKNPLLPISDTV